ncbi:MAG TPA: GNAT family N-acetyltransferase [Acidimicrobiia bacterium]|nr:GNAT family N-acetyltransferase [Acidimicrobiia bacterium]
MIRHAVLGDEDDLADVHVTAWQVAYAGIFPREFLGALDRDRRANWWRGYLERGDWAAVSEVERVIGFCVANASRDDDSWGEIFSIYVHPGHWDGGHGADLLRAGERRLRELGFSRGMLWVLEDNLRARSFYERQGWVLATPFRIEEIGGVQVTEVRYETALRG